MVSNRRGFLKQALIVIAGASVAPSVLIRAIDHVHKYHPEVQAVFDRIPVNPDKILDQQQKQAIAKFVLAEIDNGNWELMDQLFNFRITDKDLKK